MRELNEGPLAAGDCMREGCPSDTQIAVFDVDPLTGLMLGVIYECIVCGFSWVESYEN